MLGGVPWLCALASLRQFNREAFHAAGQCYGKTSHRCCVQLSSRTHFGPGGDDINRSGEEQCGNSDNGECVALATSFSSAYRHKADCANAV